MEKDFVLSIIMLTIYRSLIFESSHVEFKNQVWKCVWGQYLHRGIYQRHSRSLKGSLDFILYQKTRVKLNQLAIQQSKRENKPLMNCNWTPRFVFIFFLWINGNELNIICAVFGFSSTNYLKQSSPWRTLTIYTRHNRYYPRWTPAWSDCSESWLQYPRSQSLKATLPLS